jgi:hypothetical protein
VFLEAMVSQPVAVLARCRTSGQVAQDGLEAEKQ